MARYTLSTSQLFFLLILFQAFGQIESAPMQYDHQEYPISASGREKYTYDLVSSGEYQVNSTFNNSTSTIDLHVAGPPGEIALYIRGTRNSWDDRTIYTDRFIDQPRTRGTIGILFSCIFTLFLCVWTAFHANIVPEREDKKRGIYECLGNWRQKAFWSVIIIIFPESSLFFALFERRKANEICASIDKILHGPSNKSSKRPWYRPKTIYKLINWLSGESESSTEYWSGKQQLGYFALMGGFAIRDTRDGKNKLMTLTPCGVYLLCRCLEPADKLAKIVDDKNRTSPLAKCLVLFQVIWIIIQIICRYRSHLSVTLLETHTVIHGVCALATYLIWFKKPFDVKHPIELDIEPELHACLLRVSDKGTNGRCKELFDAEVERSHSPLGNSNTQGEGPKEPLLKSEDLHHAWECMPILAERAGQTKLVLRVLIGEEMQSLSFPDRILKVSRGLTKVWREFLILLGASLVYGGLHFWAFRLGHFPTPLEKFLWQLALYSIGAGLIGCLLALLISCYVAKHGAAGSTLNPSKNPSAWEVFFLGIRWLFVVICLTGLVLARLYFFGESFAALRDPSAKAFRMVSWTNLSFI